MIISNCLSAVAAQVADPDTILTDQTETYELRLTYAIFRGYLFSIKIYSSNILANGKNKRCNGKINLFEKYC